jgi:hypothetical protein
MRKVILPLFLFMAFAPFAHAGVRFSEVAWMGSAASSADEWIELTNDGTLTQDLSGWTIVGKGGKTVVSLSGSVPPGGYFLIERGDDETVPSVAADLALPFGKGIGNDGETLKLKDGSGSVIDTVVGGKNWKNIGGDNKTKETAQLVDGTWVTAPATPKADNKKVARVASVALEKSAPTMKLAHVESPQRELPVIHATSESEASSMRDASSSAVAANVLWQRGRDQAAEKRAWTWMLFAVILVIVATVIIMRANVETPSEADKYAIIEDIIEGKEDVARDRLGDY